jgi:hypothetical protein
MADFPDSTTLPEISRPFVEAEIERLIDLLDTLDPDPDLESTADEEPWLGAPDARTGSWFGPRTACGGDDREEDTGDDEPWLGAANPDFQLSSLIGIARTRETSQLSWCSHGSSDDREREYDDEPDQSGEGTGNYIGPCSVIGTLFPHQHQALSH